MNSSAILIILSVSVFGMLSMSLAHAQIDPISDIAFLQTGKINTAENQFHISNEMAIREFFNGNIIRVSGQTIEGFPYITYSKISDDKINSYGMIFINGKFVDLSFEEKLIPTEDSVQKNDDLKILVQYTQRVYSKHFAQIDIKIFDKEQNKLNDFHQNYGYIPNTNVDVLVIDENNQEFYSSNRVGNTNGLYEIEFWIPENNKRETLTVTINAENEDSKTTKVLQIFNLGEEPDDGKP